MNWKHKNTHDRDAATIRKRVKTNNVVLDDIITRITGKALPGQAPWIALDPIWGFVRDIILAGLFGFIQARMVGAFLASADALMGAATIVMQMLFVGRLRALQVGAAHYGIHKTYLGGNRFANSLIAHIATIIPIAQDQEAYRHDHIDLHHRLRTFGTLKDPDASFLYKLGFHPGMKRKELYRQLVSTLSSPRFHMLFLAERLRSNFMDAPAWRKVIVGTWIVCLISSGTWLGWTQWALAVLFPFTFLYANSALLQFLTEHRWMAGKLPRGDHAAYAQRSHARIALAPLPVSGLPLLVAAGAWSIWTVRMIGELLFRFYVTVGDLTVHDFHHLHGLCREPVRNWTNMAFCRQAAIDKGDPLRLQQRETVGFIAALDWVFEGLETAGRTSR